ncbi:hypothetical protein BU17DRAFT_97946 [Hysterangium stoloniferum]|nr:hypothetical protein BU17DRAFT_97946 [Hysterangium stoloniferum]
MSLTSAAFATYSLFSLCGRELLVCMFPDLELYVRTAFGFVAGIAIYTYHMHDDPHNLHAAALRLGIFTALDSLITQDLWLFLPALGWLMASEGPVRNDTNGRGAYIPRMPESKKPKAIPNRDVSTWVKPGNFNRAGTSHTRIVTFAEDSATRSLRSIIPPTPSLALSRENVAKMIGNANQDPYDRIDSGHSASSYQSFTATRPVSAHSSRSYATATSSSSGSLYRDFFSVRTISSSYSDVTSSRTVRPTELSTLAGGLQTETTPPSLPRDFQISHGRNSHSILETSPTVNHPSLPAPSELTVRADGRLIEPSETETRSETTIHTADMHGTAKTINSRAEECRQKSMAARKRISELELQRKQALQAKRAKEAFALKFAIKEKEQEAQRADRKAAKLFFKVRNPAGADSHRIDVHALKKNEALSMVERALQLRDGKELRVVVGRGKHSAGKTPVLKPYIRSKMRE